MRQGRMPAEVVAAFVVGALVVLTACSSPPKPGRASVSPTASASGAQQGAASLPPIPSESGAPGEAPVVWVGGTILDLTDRQVLVEQTVGAKVGLKRLGQDATAFYRASGGRWERVDPTEVGPGDPACVETLLDGQNLLALRVFLGTDCGPTA